MAATNREIPISLKMRVLVSLAVLILFNSIAWVYGDTFVQALLPGYQWSFEQLNPYFSLDAISIDNYRGQLYVKADAITRGGREIAGRAIDNGVPLSSSTLIGHSLQSLIVLCSAIPLWSFKHWGEWALLCLLSLPMIFIIQLIDTPLVLAGALEDHVLYSSAPHLLSSSLLVQGMQFMNSGGRLALALLGAGLVRGVQVQLCHRYQTGDDNM